MEIGRLIFTKLRHPRKTPHGTLVNKQSNLTLCRFMQSLKTEGPNFLRLLGSWISSIDVQSLNAQAPIVSMP